MVQANENLTISGIQRAAVGSNASFKIQQGYNLGTGATINADIDMRNAATGFGAITLSGWNHTGLGSAHQLGASLYSGSGGITIHKPVSLTGSAGTTRTLEAGTGSITINDDLGNFRGSIAASNKNLTLIADGISIGGNISGTRDLTIRPTTNTTIMNIADATPAGGLNLTTAELNKIQTGFQAVYMGHTGLSGAMNIGAYTWNNHVGFATGSGLITVSGAQNFQSNTAFFRTDSNIAINANLSGTGGLGFGITSSGTIMDIAGASTSNMSIDSSELARIQNGFSYISFGHGAFIILGGNLAASLLSTTGSINLNAHTWNDNVYIDNNIGSGTININGNQNFQNNEAGFTTNSNLAINANLSGTGNLVFNNFNSGSMNIATTGSGFELTAVELDRIQNGFNAIQFGREWTSNTLNLGAYTWQDNVSFRTSTGVMTVAGAQNFQGNTAEFWTDSNLAINANLSGTGSLTIRPASNTTMNIGTGAGTNLDLTTAELNFIQNGFSQLIFGHSGSTSAVNIGAYTWNDNIIFNSATGLMTVSGAQNFQSNTATFRTNSNLGIGANLSGTGALFLSTQTSTVMNIATGSGGVEITNAELDLIQDGFSSINFTTNLTNGSINVGARTWLDGTSFQTSGTGVISILGNQNFGSNAVTYLTNSLAINANLSGSDRLLFYAPTLATIIDIGSSTSNLSLDTAELDRIQDGFNQIEFGWEFGSGAMNIAAYTWKDNVRFTTGSGLMTVAGDQNFQANNGEFWTNSNLAINANLSGTSELIIRPSGTVVMNIGTGAGTNLDLSTAELNRIQNGFSQIIFGHSGLFLNQNIGAYTWNDNVRFITGSGSMNISGAQNFQGNNAEFWTDSDLGINANLSGTGTLIIRPIANTIMNIGDGAPASGLKLTDAELNRIQNGFSQLTFGHTGATGAINIGAYTWNDDVQFLLGTGLAGISVNGAQNFQGNTALLRTNGSSDIILNATLSSTATGNAITLASGGNFINNAGASAISTPNGRWLVYSQDPALNTLGGITSDFLRYSCTYGGSCPTFPAVGNGLLYSSTPILNLNISAINPNLQYGSAVPTAFTYSLTGYNPGDDTADVIMGTASWNTSFTSLMNAGTSYFIDYVSGLSSSLGYAFNNARFNGTVLKRNITATVDVATSRAYGAANPIWNRSNVTWNNLVNGDTNAVLDTLTVSAPTALATSNAGTSHAVNILGFSDDNYNLTGFTAGNLGINALPVVAPPVVIPPINNNLLLSSSVERVIPEIILSNNNIENKAPQIEPTSNKKVLVNTVSKSESNVIKNSGFSLIRYTDALIKYLSLRSTDS
jgi:hypothetical protein